jgi:hypothetical protein
MSEHEAELQRKLTSWRCFFGVIVWTLVMAWIFCT